MANPFDLSGRTALITGANTGIGQAIAVALARAGANIVVAGRSAPDETAAAVAATGRTFDAITADLSDAANAGEVVRQATARGIAVDILVNNAGIIRRSDALELTEADWDAVMDVNLKSVFFLCQAAAREMIGRGRGGKIINI